MTSESNATAKATQRAAAAVEQLRDRADRLEAKKGTGYLVAVTKRFFDIDGVNQSALLAIELFTVVIPLMVIGFSYAAQLTTHGSFGNLFIRETGIEAPYDRTVRRTFGTSTSVTSALSLVGLLGFLAWGIPMAITVARMFAFAWRREQFGFGTRLWRGTVWFVLYLTAMSSSQAILFAHGWGGPWLLILFLLSSIPTFLFWMFSPVLLVQGGITGWKYLVFSGFAGMVIEGIVLRIAGRIAIPLLIEGWSGFGPIGVAMTLMTWCGVIGTGWVISACAGAVAWERSAPDAIVAFTETADDGELPALDTKL